ncbi:MAG: hypothetical protein LBI45_07320 [Bacteroidales bacterium]|jgi:hypothetical protein|nr:hypothetical protein [Bacteroidales bacterium]
MRKGNQRGALIESAVLLSGAFSFTPNFYIMQQQPTATHEALNLQEVASNHPKFFKRKHNPELMEPVIKTYVVKSSHRIYAEDCYLGEFSANEHFLDFFEESKSSVKAIFLDGRIEVEVTVRKTEKGGAHAN